MDVSIIIVNYNTQSILEKCLTSIFAKTFDIEYEVIVSDNGSIDGSIKMIKENFPSVILLENNDNLGFGKANNNALKVSKGKYIFYLNSDTILLNNAVKQLFDYFEKADKNTVGAIGSYLLDENNCFIHSGGNFPTINNVIKKAFFDLLRIIKLSFCNKKLLFTKNENEISNHQKTPSIVTEVDYITGADLFMPNNEFAQFDESFFLYYEDTDLQKSLKEKTNKKTYLIPGPKIQHLEHKSNKYLSKLDFYVSIMKLNHTLSGVRYFSKHKENKLKILFLKFLILLQWYNPKISSKTKKFRTELRKI